MSQLTIHAIIVISDTKRVKWVYDESYQSEGSYAYDTEEETAKAVKEEQEKLDSYEWVALGAITEEKCSLCRYWHATDSVWGIVTENKSSHLEQLAKDLGIFP